MVVAHLVPTSRSQAPIATLPSASELEILARLAVRFPQLLPGFDASERVTVSECVDAFREDLPDQVSQRTFENYAKTLRDFVAVFGDRRACTLVPRELRGYILANSGRLKAGHTKARTKNTIMRLFHWCVEERLLKSHPFAPCRMRFDKNVGRPIRPDEFQALLRHSDRNLRRLLLVLKFTGARPGELSRAKWENIDWHNRAIVLTEHKTVHSTVKPRVIVCVPAVMKLLAIIARERHGPCATELRRLLLIAPNNTMPAKDVMTRLRRMRFSPRQIGIARKRIGAEYLAGGRANPCYYRLPKNPIELEPHDDGYIFQTRKFTPWNRHSLSHKWRRLRRRIGIPADVRPYSLRHLFATTAIKNDTHLHATAKLLGHTSTRLLETVYAHVGEDMDYLHRAAKKAVGLKTEPTPLAAPESRPTVIYPRAKPKRRVDRPATRPLNEPEKRAHRLYTIALETDPALVGAPYAEVYDWLKQQPGASDQLPPSIATFKRYCNCTSRYLIRDRRRRGVRPYRVSPRDAWIIEQRSAGRTDRAIFEDLRIIGPPKRWRPLYSIPAIRQVAFRVKNAIGDKKGGAL